MSVVLSKHYQTCIMYARSQLDAMRFLFRKFLTSLSIV